MTRGQVERALAERFTRDLDCLLPPEGRIGLAVSGGPDSLALLLLTAAARPGTVEAATVNHGLRTGSAAEADFVEALCTARGIAHVTLRLSWTEPPRTGVQERARGARYAALGQWATQRGLAAIATAHHREDQAETLLMRLARGAGVRGLGGMRATGQVPACPAVPLIRPLLLWAKHELEGICTDAGIEPVRDPSNDDLDFERVRVRQALRDSPWLDPEALGRSAAHLTQADEALEWAAAREWPQVAGDEKGGMTYCPSAPPEIRRRIVTRILRQLGHEGTDEPRGRELERLIVTLEGAGTATLRGVRCSGGPTWRFSVAPPRQARSHATS